MREKNEKRNIQEILASVNQRLAALEQLIARENKPIHEKIALPSHDLESNAKVMTESGVADVSNVPVCSVCHGLLQKDEHFFICHHCSRVLCDVHGIILNNRAHCEEDLRKYHFDLSRRDYKTLVCTANGVEEVEKIAEITSMDKEDVVQSLAKLFTSNLIVCKTTLFGLVKKIEQTDDGLLAISTYRQYVYGHEEAMEQFGKVLRRYLAEEKGLDA